MKASLVILLLGFLLIVPQMVPADDKVIESYSASLANMQGAGRGPIQIKLLIYSYTPEDEVQKMAQTLKQGGQDALEKALWDIQRGKVAPVGALGVDVNYVRVLNSDKGKIIRMVTARPMSFLELRNNGRSTDYPFGIVELVIGNDGKVEGSIIAAAKIEINKDNVLEVESYGTQPLRLMSLRKND